MLITEEELEEISVAGQEEEEEVTVTAQLEFTEPVSAEAAAATAISRDPTTGLLLFSCRLDWGPSPGEGDRRPDSSGVEGRLGGRGGEGGRGEGDEECCCSSVVALAVIMSILAVSGVI